MELNKWKNSVKWRNELRCGKIRFTDKEQKKFEDLYDTYSRLMYYIAFDILKDEGLAQDAVQEAFINICKTFSKISEQDCKDLKGFVVIVIRRVAINMYNKQKKNKIISLDVFLENRETSGKQAVHRDIPDISSEENRIMYYMQKLPSKYADILLFYYVYGYSAEEMAQIFDMKTSTVYSYLSRGRKKLEKLLEGKRLFKD